MEICDGIFSFLMVAPLLDGDVQSRLNHLRLLQIASMRTVLWVSNRARTTVTNTLLFDKEADFQLIYKMYIHVRLGLRTSVRNVYN